MNKKRLLKIRKELAAKQQSSASARDMEAIAKSLGRKMVKRGKEPTWEQTDLKNRPPLAIPHHGGRDLSIRVKRSIISVLEEDADCWEFLIDEN